MAVGQVFRDIFFWNLTTPVGRGAPNKLDDVELVRFGYVCLRENAQAGTSPGLKAALGRMNATGAFGPDLQLVIDEHQKVRGGTVDGKISVARPALLNSGTYDHQHLWIIILLNAHMGKMMKEFPYPRIDLDLRTGPAITDTAAKCFSMGQ